MGLVLKRIWKSEIGGGMETLELPVIEIPEEEVPQATCAEQDIDLAAFRLWREASLPENEPK